MAGKNVGDYYIPIHDIDYVFCLPRKHVLTLAHCSLLPRIKFKVGARETASVTGIPGFFRFFPGTIFPVKTHSFVDLPGSRILGNEISGKFENPTATGIDPIGPMWAAKISMIKTF